MSDRSSFEVVIIGAGIAGVSLAYFLVQRGVTDILLLERENELARHSTGRSAASLVEFDPIPTVQRLKILGGKFLGNPPEGFCENPVLKRSGVAVLFRTPMPQAVTSSVSNLERAGVRFEIWPQSAVLDRVPELSSDHFDGALFLPDDGRIDVHELLSSYLRQARSRGATLRFGAEVDAIRVENERAVAVKTGGEEIRARWIVNSSGAWAGRVSALAGASPIRLQPMRRTIVTFQPPDGLDVNGWPFVISEADHLYFTPEAGAMLMSAMDEEPSEPCDAHPDDMVVAQALDRLSRLAPRLVPRSLGRKWAGLRTFAPDGVAVVGEDPALRGFFWLAGQGGCGIETSPAVGSIAADLIVDGRTDRFDHSLLAPSRFIRE